jgi:hypothetical protein
VLTVEPLVPLLESALPSVLKLALDRRRISLKNEGAIIHLRKLSEFPIQDRALRSFKPGTTAKPSHLLRVVDQCCPRLLVLLQLKGKEAAALGQERDGKLRI